MQEKVFIRNNVKIFGEGQPLMFAHGFGCDQNMWRFITPAFEQHYQIVLFDYVGSGNSDIAAYNSEKYNDLNGYATDILDIVNALHLKDVIFVGHSVSCMIGLLAALKQPESFNKMIFVGPSARYINELPGYTGGFERKDIQELLETMDKNYIGWANFMGPAIMKNSENPGLGVELTQSFCSTDPVIARQFAEVTFLSDNRIDLPKLRIPSLILQCSDDLIAPIEVGHFIHQQIPGSTLKIMKATGHCPHMSAPAETIDLMSAYLFNAN
jgi:sigma-B regulation protein RsbQ